MSRSIHVPAIDYDPLARIREKVRETAEKGDLINSRRFTADDLETAFEGREHELSELVELAEQKAAERREQQQRKAQARAQRQQLQRETEKVLAEWREQERQKAEKEARMRLGL